MLKQTNWSSPEIRAKVEEIAAELEKHGFEELPRNYRIGEVAFRIKDGIRKFYQGTYLNWFSRNDPVPFYYNSWMEESKTIVITEVFRHNGTAANTSLDCIVSYCGCKDEPKPFTMHWKEDDGSIVEQTTPKWTNIGDRKLIRRFKPTLSAKLQAKMIAEAIAKYDTYELKDWSFCELNPKDFPKDTEKEHDEYMAKVRERNKAIAEAARNK